MNEQIEYFESTKKCTFEEKYKNLVQTIVQTRTEAKFTQQFLAEWIEVDRRKVIEFETGEKYDIPLLLKLCDKLSIELELNFKQH